MKDTSDLEDKSNSLASSIIGAAIDVHSELGPGLLESAYEEALCHELKLRGLSFIRQKNVPVQYKGIKLDCGYRIDLFVEDLVVVELKSVLKIEPVFTAQLLTYLKQLNVWLGLLLNFNLPVMKQGIKRMVN